MCYRLTVMASAFNFSSSYYALFVCWFSCTSPVLAETVLAMGEKKWVRDIIWTLGLLFDEVFKVSLRSKLTFSNVISPLANYIMNNL